MDQECTSNGGWWTVLIQSKSDPDHYHAVVINPWERSEEAAICDCKGYEFRTSCAHQKLALAQICQWDSSQELQQSPEQKRLHQCPKCKGRTRSVI